MYWDTEFFFIREDYIVRQECHFPLEGDARPSLPNIHFLFAVRCWRLTVGPCE